MVVDRAGVHKPEQPNRCSDWTFLPGASYTVHMPLSRDDRPVIVVATLAVLVAGVLVALVLLLATGRGGSPKTYEPFPAGAVLSIKSDLKDGGPYFVPDPFGGDRNILFALEDGHVVALSNVVPDTKHCVVNVKDEGKSFVDCHGDRLKTADLARFVTTTKASSNGTEILYVDLRKKEPAPASAPATTAPATAAAS